MVTPRAFNRLYTPDFRAVPAVVPPALEQSAIVRFVDYADRRVRRYIRAKQKLIKLLEEQKQAVIHHVVTRGLDPNVRLKPSGIPGPAQSRDTGYFAAGATSAGFTPIINPTLHLLQSCWDWPSVPLET
jgi:hypothetical protein